MEVKEEEDGNWACGKENLVCKPKSCKYGAGPFLMCL